jgi:NADH-quinone oxidoreductase subunit M
VLLEGIILFLAFDPNMVLQTNRNWIDAFGLHYHLALDGISLPILLSIVIITPVIVLLIDDKPKGYWGNVLFLQGGVTGAVLAQDLILFYLFWEVMLVPVFFMIGMYGKDDKIMAAWKVTLYTFFGSFLMLVAIFYLGYTHFAQSGFWSFSINDLRGMTLSSDQQFWLFWGFMAALAIKIPLFPFHMWLPVTYSQAPSATVVFLSSVMAKLGVYAILRFLFVLFPEMIASYANLFLTIGIFGFIYFGIVAIMQQDIKKLLAYASASHLSLIVIGIFSLNAIGIGGALFLIFAHALSTGALFLLADKLENTYGTREISKLGGIAQQAPLFTVFFTIMLLTAVGMPGTNGFVSELLIIMGAFKYSISAGVLTATTVVVAVSFMLWMFGKAILGKKTNKEQFLDLRWYEVCALIVVSAIIIYTGINPNSFIRLFEPSVSAILQGGIL